MNFDQERGGISPTTEIDAQIHEATELAEALTQALRQTLDLSENECVFAGNEAVLFVHLLLRKNPPGDPGPIQADTFFSARRLHAAMVQPKPETRLSSISQLVSVSARASRDAGRRLFRRRALLLTQSLQQQVDASSNLLHVGAYAGRDIRKRSQYVIPNLTDASGLYFSRNLFLRERFRAALLDNRVSQPLAQLFANTFPTSSLEGYHAFAAHPLAQANPDVVCTNIYSLMGDPLLSSLIRRSRATTVYIQHGGHYGFRENAPHRIEAEGADKMLWWGVGEHNVYPTRYSDEASASGQQNCRIVMSAASTKADLDYFTEIAEGFRNALDCQVCTHPRAKPNHRKQRIGINQIDHKSAGLVVYDSIYHSLIYERLLIRRPLLIIQSDDIRPQHANAASFIKQLRDHNILIDRDSVVRRIQQYARTVKRGLRPNDFMAPAVSDRLCSLSSLADLYPPCDDKKNARSVWRQSAA